MKHRTSIFRPVVLTFLMAIPFGIGVGFIPAGIYEVWREFKREVLEVEIRSNYHSHSLGFLADGTPILHDYKITDQGMRQDLHSHMDGTPITPDEREEILYPQQLRTDRRRHPFDREPFEELLSNRNRWWGFRDPEKKGSIMWTWEPVNNFSTDRILVARHRTNDTAVWFVTSDGFVPGSPQLPESIKGFEQVTDWRQEDEMVAFQSEGKLKAINLIDKTVETIADIDGPQQSWSMFQQNDTIGWRFAIQSSDTIRFYSDRGEQLFAHSAGSPELMQPILIYTPTNGSFIVTHVKSREIQQKQSRGRYGHSRIKTVATWVDESGEITRTLEYQNEVHSDPPRSSSSFVNSIDWFMESIGPGLVVPEPAVVVAGIFVVAPWVSHSMFPERPASETIDEILEHIPYAIPVSALVALICAIACWRRQQRYHADWTKTWVVFVFLFGVPAWIAWRVHRRWPPLNLVGTPDVDFIGPAPNGLEIR